MGHWRRHDDGSGIVHTIEALRALQAIGYQPRRTLRFVLFINEEMATAVESYAEHAEMEHEQGKRHVAAMESDAGQPRGVRMDALDEPVLMVRGWSKLLEPYNLHYFGRGGTGVDIERTSHAPCCWGSFPTDSVISIFIIRAKTFGKTSHKRELELGAATCAMIALR